MADVTVTTLVVAGGGGGGKGSAIARGAGGGGAGGVRSGTQVLPLGNYPVVVGVGGAAATTGSVAGSNGGDSSVGSMTALGGGGGGPSDVNVAAGNGGSGGGAGDANGLSAAGGTGTAGQGSNGAANSGSAGNGGSGAGGGGAGTVGTAGVSGGASRSAGGGGLASAITGTSVTYAAGGSGGESLSGTAGPAGASNSGNGGGGGGGQTGAAGGAGGSGVVIISYPVGATSATGGTITTVGGNTIHTFTSNGTFTITALLAATAGVTVGAAANLTTPAPLAATAGLRLSVSATFAAAALASTSTLGVAAAATLTAPVRFAAASTFAFSTTVTFAVTRFAAAPVLQVSTVATLTTGTEAAHASTVRILLAGVDARARVAGLTIRDVLNDAPNSCTLTLDGAEVPACEQALRVELNLDAPRLLFNGALQTVGQTYEGRPEQVAHPCTAIDDTARANRMRPFGSWINVSATAFARDLIAQFAPGFTTVHVQNALPPVTIILDGTEGMSGALTQAATQIGGYFYFEDTDLHFFITEATEPPDAIDGTPGRLLDDPPIAITRDDSQLRTRQHGRAHGEALLADVAGGETILPVENAAAWFGTVTPGGHALAVDQRLAYAGVQVAVGGALVGPGAGPTVAPTVTATAGDGLASGVYKYAYTDATAAGESLPSPLASATAGSVTGGLLADPVSAPTPTVSLTPGGVPVGSWAYRVSFTNAAGETLPGPYSATVAVNVITNSGPPFNWAYASTGGSMTPFTYYRYALSFLDGLGNETEAFGDNLSWSIGTGQGSLNLTGLNVNSDPRATGKRLYRSHDGGTSYQLIVQLDNAITSYIDTAANATGSPQRFLNSTGPTVINLTAIPTGPSGTTGRKIYRDNRVGWRGLVGTITNNSATTFADVNPGFGADWPSANTTGTTTALNQITVSGIATGAAGTTSRKLYRTAANGAQLKLLATLANNTATSYGIDVAADASLGANIPVSDTSGLGGSAIAGTVLAGSTTLPTSGTGPFNSAAVVVPTAPPVVTGAPGLGIADGAHEWAYTWLTTSGETLPSPRQAITLGPVGAPTAPVASSATGGPGIGIGTYDYVASFLTASGETLPSGASNAVVVNTVSVTPPPAPVLVSNGPNSNGAGASRTVGQTVWYSVTYVTANGETLPSPALAVTVQWWAPNHAKSSEIVFSFAYSTNPGVIGVRIYSQSYLGGPFRHTGWGDATGTIPNKNGGTDNAVDSGGDLASGIAPPSVDGSAYAPGTIPITLALGPATVTGRRLYRRVNLGPYQLVATVANNSATTYTDTAPNGSLGGPPLTVATALPNNQAAITALAVGPANIVSRKLYRTAVGGGLLKLVATIANNTATSYTDTTPDASLGATAPSSDTSGGNTVVGGWAIIGNNLAIRYTGISGNNLTGIPAAGPGAIQTSVLYGTQVLPAPALVGVTGVGAMGSPRLVLDVKAGPYGSGLGAGVWQYAVTFSSPSGESLPSPPVTVTTDAVHGFGVAVGPGQLPVGATFRNIYRTKNGGTQLYFIQTATAAFYDQTPSTSLVVPAPTVDTSGLTAIVGPTPKGTPINVWVQRDDLAAQAEQAAVDAANGIVPADGIYEGPMLVDERRNEASMIAACDAQLAQFAAPIVTVTYACRDVKTKSGKTVVIDLDTPAIHGTFTIQEVTITEIDIAPGLLPRFSVTASSTRFSLDDILRRLLRATDATSNYSGS